MQHERRNISMLMDLYEMTMAHGYFTKQDNTDRVAFDVFYRRNPDKGGFAIFGGLEQVLEYILNLHFDEEDMAYFKSLHLFSDEFLEYLRNFKFTGDVYAFKEGTIIYPNEPIMTIVAPLIDAQIVETAVLTMINHQSLIATKANRIVRARRWAHCIRFWGSSRSQCRCCCIWCAGGFHRRCQWDCHSSGGTTIWDSCKWYHGT